METNKYEDSKLAINVNQMRMEDRGRFSYLVLNEDGLEVRNSDGILCKHGVALRRITSQEDEVITQLWEAKKAKDAEISDAILRELGVVSVDVEGGN